MNSAGLADLQVNGFAGLDFNGGSGDGRLTPAALDRALEAVLATGVTTLLPTVITATETELRDRFAALDAAIAGSRLGRLMCPGFHLEGPFLNPADGYAGCHPAASMRLPEYGLVERLDAMLGRPILLVTVAPELDGADAFIRRARAAGKLVSLGHSAAGFDAVERAAGLGAGLVTHLGNGLPQVLPKLANPIFAQLAEDRLLGCFIADGIHIPPHALRALMRAKGLDRCVLVSDAVAAAAAPAGRYPFAGMTVERAVDSTVRVPGQASLAGSSLCLDAAVRNLVAWGIAAAEEAVVAASDRPRAALAPALAAHGLVLPDSAVAWSDDLRVRAVRVGAEQRHYPLPPDSAELQTCRTAPPA